MSTAEQVRSPLQVKLREYVNACFTGIYVQTNEPDEAVREIRDMAGENAWNVLLWDIDRGLCADEHHLGDGNQDPTAPVKALRRCGDNGDGATILLLPNYHRFIGDALVLQTLHNTLAMGKQSRTFCILLGPGTTLPVEIEKSFVVVEHELPDRATLAELMRAVAGVDDMPTDDVELGRLLDAAAGLTRYEAEGAFALSLARHGRLDVSVLWELKAGMLKKAGTLELHQGDETFADLGGLEGLKEFCGDVLRSKSKFRPKGVMLLGVPGSGKSAFAKALGNETTRPTVTLDFGALKGSLVGQSEQQTRAALKAIDAMAPCILFIDEVEKGLSGSSGHDGDNGVSKGILGSFLKWMNDHTSDVFVVCTSNKIADLPPEFSRAERFDAVFFFDMPTPEQRDAIWSMYAEKFEIAEDPGNSIDDDQWTGAEIKACCRLAALRDCNLADAAKSILPVAGLGDNVAKLREWADGKVLDANTGCKYRRPETQIKGDARGRQVVRYAK